MQIAKLQLQGMNKGENKWIETIGEQYREEMEKIAPGKYAKYLIEKIAE